MQAMVPVAFTSGGVGASLGATGLAIMTYATVVAPIKARLQALAAEAAAFVASARKPNVARRGPGTAAVATPASRRGSLTGWPSCRQVARWSLRVGVRHLRSPELGGHLPGCLREDVSGLHQRLEVGEHG